MVRPLNPGSNAAQLQALAEQKRKTTLRGPFIILQFGIKPYYCQAGTMWAPILSIKFHQNRLDANAAFLIVR